MDHKTPSENKPPVTPAEKPVAKPAAAAPVGETKQVTGKVFSRKPATSNEAEQGDAESSSSKRSRTKHKAPCSQCGAPTRIKVLEKTGDLCARCYSPVGYYFIRIAAVLGILAVVGGGMAAWKIMHKPGAEAPQSNADQTDQKEKGFSSDQKVDILRRHLLDGVPIANLGVEPNDYQQWQQIFFQAGERAFDPVTPRDTGSVERRISTIEQKIQMANKILGELRDNVTQLRKESGRYEATPAQKFILDSVGTPPRDNKAAGK